MTEHLAMARRLVRIVGAFLFVWIMARFVAPLIGQARRRRLVARLSMHVLALLWAGLASHLHERGYEHVMGCASLPEDGAADACARLLRDHLAPPDWRVTPNHPLPLDGADPTRRVPYPPLIRGYLRMGAVVCGPPAWDPAFRTADVVMVLPMQRMARRFAERFQRAA